jgi:hypothetical protein
MRAICDTVEKERESRVITLRIKKERMGTPKEGDRKRRVVEKGKRCKRGRKEQRLHDLRRVRM